MIIKSLSRKSNASQLVKYICRYILDPKKQDIEKGSFLIRHNIRGGSNIRNYVKEFAANNENRLFKRKDQATIQHIILSWSNKDSHLISDKMLRDLAKKFIALRGENNLWVGTCHRDRSHLHIHLAMSAVQLNGRSSRISKAQFEKLKEDMDRYQALKYPQLSNSLPERGKNRKTAFWENSKIQQLHEFVQSAQSMTQLIDLLKEQNIEPYYRLGKLQGIISENKKYRLKRLGISDQKLKELDVLKSRYGTELAELSNIRDKGNRPSLAKESFVRELIFREAPE
jgi:hypothetical protein